MSIIDKAKGLFARGKEDNPLDNSPEIPDSDRLLANKIKKEYRAGVAFKRSQGYYDKWAEYDRFWNADQWPQPTEDTKEFPRPVTNQFASIIEQKVAALVYEAPELYYEPMEGEPEQETADDEASNLLTQAAKHQAHKLDLDNLLEDFCRDAAVLCNGILFFPWDNSITGGIQAAYIGDIAGYQIDPADIFPGDPTNPDVQTQPYLLLAERKPLEEVREFHRSYAPDIVDFLKAEKQTSDTQVYDHQRVEMDETGYVDVVHRFWKDKYDPEYDTSPPPESEEGAEQQPVRPGQKVVYYAAECQGHIISPKRVLYRHGLYPFVSFQWYPKRKSFFGKPESADIIANQKEANHLDGIMLLAAYYTALPQRLYKEGAIDERDLSTHPGEAIKDRSQPGQWGMNYLQPPHMPAYPAAMRDKLEASMKDVAGVHEAWSGKAPSSDLNASAILALQEAAGVRIRGIQRRLYRAVRDIARLWLAHWKEFGQEARLIRIVGDGHEVGFEWFRGTDYGDMEYDVLVQAGPASPFSRSLYMTHLDNMLERQIIAPDEYLELIPADVFPKAKMIAERRDQRQEEMMQVAQQAQMQTLEAVAGSLGIPAEQLIAMLQQGPMPEQPAPVAGMGGAM